MYTLLPGTGLVVSSDASGTVRSIARGYADVYGNLVGVGDGTADDVQKQAAIDALPTGGGTIILSEGTFDLAAQVSMASKVWLEGQGEDITVLQRVAASNISLVAITGSYSGIANLTLDGNKSAGSPTGDLRGLDLTGASFNTLDNVKILNTYGNGLYAVNTTDKTVFWWKNLFVLACGSSASYYGVYLDKVAGIYSVGHILSSSVGSNLRLNTVSESTFVGGVYDVSSGQHNIWIGNGANANRVITFLGGYNGGCFNTGLLIEGTGTNNIVVDGMQFRGNGTVGNTRDVYITQARNISIVNSIFERYADREIEGIMLVGAGNNHVLTGNHFSSDGVQYPTPIDTSTYTGTGTIIRNNQGWVTENSGAATVASGATTVAVTHGLAATPTRVLLATRLWSNSAKAWVTALGATTFTINVDIDPGAGTAIFDWKAQVGEG